MEIPDFLGYSALISPPTTAPVRLQAEPSVGTEGAVPTFWISPVASESVGTKMGSLTAVAVKAGLANPGTYQDGDGLFLKVKKSGGASWMVRVQRDGKLEAWRRHYNEERPHSAIGNIPPIMLANSAGETSPPEPSKAENSRPTWSEVG